MSGIKYEQLRKEIVRAGVERRVGYTDHLMMAVMDFYNGPQAEPDPPHSHPHEQVTYVAEGEIIFFLENQPVRLCAGDMFTVPSDKPHSIQVLTGHVRLIDSFTPVREDYLQP